MASSSTPDAPDPARATHVLADDFPSALTANVVVVTGKGGVGKTTVAATLGIACAAAGRATLLVEVEGRDSLSRALGTDPWDYHEQQLRTGLWGTSLDPTDAVLEYLELFHGMRRVQWALERSHALDFVTTAAPGLGDLLLVGKVYEIETRRAGDGRRRYDTIIMDAPPTGRIVPFLAAPAGVTEIVQVGTIRRQAAQITRMLTDPARAQVAMVTLPEELPVTEAIEATGQLRAGDVRVGPLVLNRMEPELATATQATRIATVDVDRVIELLAGVGLDWGRDEVTTLAAGMTAHRATIDHQARMQARLEHVATTMISLPHVVARPGHAPCDLLAAPDGTGSTTSTADTCA